MSEADCPGMTIAVHRGDWPNLSPEFAAMVAPPISVSSLPVSGSPEPGAWRLGQQARSRANMPVDRARRPNR